MSHREKYEKYISSSNNLGQIAASESREEFPIRDLTRFEVIQNRLEDNLNELNETVCTLEVIFEKLAGYPLQNSDAELLKCVQAPHSTLGKLDESNNVFEELNFRLTTITRSLKELI